MRNNSHQGKVMSINKLTMDLHGTKKTPNIEVHGGIKAMSGDIRITHIDNRNQRSNHNQYQGGKEEVGPHVQISLGWMDARAWY
jgi:hypothetical protein